MGVPQFSRKHLRSSDSHRLKPLKEVTFPHLANREGGGGGGGDDHVLDSRYHVTHKGDEWVREGVNSLKPVGHHACSDDVSSVPGRPMKFSTASRSIGLLHHAMSHQVYTTRRVCFSVEIFNSLDRLRNADE